MTKSMHPKDMVRAEEQTHKAIEQWPHSEQAFNIWHRTTVQNSAELESTGREQTSWVTSQVEL